MPPTFLTLEEVLIIHSDQIERYGGDEGIRDADVLRSSLAMPQSGASGQYFNGDLFEMAAAYLFHIARNHPFLDGNKRTALMCALVFLGLNGLRLEAEADPLYALVDGVAAGTADKAEVAVFLRQDSISR